MKLVELTGVKGARLWINPNQLLYVAASEPNTGGGSMYGDNNVSVFTRLSFSQGATLDVRESIGEIVSRLAD